MTISDCELKVDALIDALGFDVEDIPEQAIPSGQVLIPRSFKFTKRRGLLPRLSENVLKFIQEHREKVSRGCVGNGCEIGEIYFFEAHTYCLSYSYSDDMGDAPFPSPIVPDGQGFFPEIFIAPPYKVLIKDKCGRSLFECDC